MGKEGISGGECELEFDLGEDAGFHVDDFLLGVGEIGHFGVQICSGRVYFLVF